MDFRIKQEKGGGASNVNFFKFAPILQSYLPLYLSYFNLTHFKDVGPV